LNLKEAKTIRGQAENFAKEPKQFDYRFFFQTLHSRTHITQFSDLNFPDGQNQPTKQGQTDHKILKVENFKFFV
jgi:hypothetical protein